MTAFSRLQLAAALLEYDNEPDNPNAPRRSAQDSAIFSHLRRANGYLHGATVEEATRTRDLLGVALPSEAGGSIDVKSTTIKSRTASVDLLQNPFGGDDEEPEQEEEALEVDLTSWGLDSFMPKEKGSKASRKAKGKAKSEILPGTRNSSTFGTNDNAKTTRISHTRAMSDFGMGGGGAFLDSIPENGMRRNSVSNPLDMERDSDSERLAHRYRTSSYGVIEDLPVKLPLHQRSSFFEVGRDTIPFPTSSSPGPDSELGLGTRTPSRLDGRGRTQSAATMGATAMEADENNPFAIPPPPEERASRFDPKYTMSHARTNSNATRLSAGAQQAYEDEVFEERAGSRMSGFTGKQRRDRRVSAASFGTRDMLDDDDYAYDGFEDQPMPEKRYSRLDLMRPKVLIMPSPLQSENVAPPPPKPSREGFLDSSDARPLPPGARSSRLSMLQSSSDVNFPAPGNSFTPNPRLSLSASQLLFRNNLTVDGQRDVSHRDIDGTIRRAEKDGEKVQLELPEDVSPQVKKPAEDSSPVEESPVPFRPAGKLFGRSLIDDLENRKQQMRNKQRVFYGDQRPSMMDRGQPKRSSTFIDPASLQLPVRPTPSRANSAGTTANLQRKGSRGGKPLLTFGEDGQLIESTAKESATQQPQAQQLSVPNVSGSRNSRIPKAHSVFGADKLWEKEMEKLEIIKAQEKVEEEERRKREEVEGAKRAKKKGRGKKKSRKHEEESRNVEHPVPVEEEEIHREAVNQPLLPDIAKVSTRRRTAPVLVDDDSDDESSASEAGSRPTGIRDEAADKWVSDDEEGGKTKAMSKIQSNSQFGGIFVNPDDDSDEDVPLSMTLQRRASKNFLSQASAYRDGSDSDEDRPLSTLLLPSKSKRSELSADFEYASSPRSPLSQQKEQSFNGDDDEEEDNVPLGIRASRIPTMASGLFSQSGRVGMDDDEDDRPLAMHPEQIRRSQFQAFTQMQQQQQMYEAQMRSSMMFNPMMMMPPVPAFAPSLPSQDNAKFGRVDRWRRDVAVEGEA